MNDTKYRRQAMLIWQEERDTTEEELRTSLTAISRRLHALLSAVKHLLSAKRRAS